MQSPESMQARRRANAGAPNAESTLDLSKLLQALQSVRDGDFSARLPSDQTGLAGKVADTFNEIVAANQRLALELERVGQIVGKDGKTRHRMSSERRSGAWGAMEHSVNTLIDDLLWPTTEVDLERANRALQSEVGERTRAEQALKEADRHKNEFLAILAHELRNPLAPIRNAVHLMKMKTLDDPQVGLARDIIERQLAHLTRLVDDLLDVSRITRGKINLTRQRLEVGDLIDRAVETVEPAIQARSHRLSIEIVDRALAVYGDPLRLTQAIANILGNAAKYTECGGHIDVRCRRRNRDIEICVRDTGIGIEPEVLPRIFDLFTQLDHRMERSQSGLGIGLALVRRLVEMHGGTVTAQSEGAGYGSEFVVRLPLSIERTEDPGGEIPEVDPQKMVADGRRILIADDNADALESLATLLSLNGHQVFRAPDGEAALGIVERLKPEIALLDIGMPRVDGYEVARRIRTLEGGQNIMLVALTGWGQDSDRRRAQEAGFDAHLTKPVDLDRLGQLFGEGLGRNRAVSAGVVVTHGP